MTEETTQPQGNIGIDTEQENKKVAIAPRFTKEECDGIDHYRGERTKTEFVYYSVMMWCQLEKLLAPYLTTMAIDPKGRTAPFLICDAVEFYLQPVTNPPTWNAGKATAINSTLEDSANDVLTHACDPEQLAYLDQIRGENPRILFVMDAVLSQLKVAKVLETEKKKRSVVLKHDCGEKYDVMPSGNDVFLICKKCHKSNKVTKAEYDSILNEAAKA